MPKTEALKQGEILRKKAKEKEEKENKERQKKIFAQFSKFLEDESYFSDYDMYELLNKEMLIRVFRYREEEIKKSPILLSFDDDSTAASVYDRNFAIAKIIKVGPLVKNFGPGDVVTLADQMAGTSINPDYTQWLADKEAAMNSRPPGQVGPMPPKYTDNLISWSKHMFVANKLSPRTQDDYQTFLVPDTYATAKIKSDNDISE